VGPDYHASCLDLPDKFNYEIPMQSAASIGNGGRNSMILC